MMKQIHAWIEIWVLMWLIVVFFFASFRKLAGYQYNQVLINHNRSHIKHSKVNLIHWIQAALRILPSDVDWANWFQKNGKNSSTIFHLFLNASNLLPSLFSMCDRMINQLLFLSLKLNKQTKEIYLANS